MFTYKGAVKSKVTFLALCWLQSSVPDWKKWVRHGEEEPLRVGSILEQSSPVLLALSLPGDSLETFPGLDFPLGGWAFIHRLLCPSVNDCYWKIYLLPGIYEGRGGEESRHGTGNSRVLCCRPWVWSCLYPDIKWDRRCGKGTQVPAASTCTCSRALSLFLLLQVCQQLRKPKGRLLTFGKSIELGKKMNLVSTIFWKIS